MVRSAPNHYAILNCNAAHGSDCIALLKEAGAPDVAQSEIDVALEKARATVRPGQGARTDLKEHRADGTKLQRGSNNATYLAKRLQESHSEIFEALERGEFKSVRAAAKAAGIVRDLTPIEQLQKWWRKASDDERAAFRDYIDTPVFDEGK